MATRSRIGMLNEDGTVSSIYCHWDGYPDHNGRILKEDYSDAEKVKSLLALGSISSLRHQVAPTDEQDHSFDNPCDDVTVAYHRDRGEEYDAPRTDQDEEHYAKSDIEEYGYLYKEGQWYIIDTYRKRGIVPIEERL